MVLFNKKRNRMKETFEDYLQKLKDRRTEDDYKYTDEDFEKNKDYISDCCKSGMSVYKCLELMYFAEKDMDDQLFNREPKQERKKNFYCGDEVDYDIKQKVRENAPILVNKQKILEDFTIGFAEWLLKNYDGIKSVKQLLEIYKKTL